MRPLLLSVLVVANCTGSTERLRACVEENSAYGHGFVRALMEVEDNLLALGVLPALTREGYGHLITAIDEDTPLPTLEEICSPPEQCWLLTTPASTAAYPYCTGRLATVNETDDLGPGYMRTVLAALSDEEFHQPVHRGELLQLIAATIERPNQTSE